VLRLAVVQLAFTPLLPEQRLVGSRLRDVPHAHAGRIVSGGRVSAYARKRGEKISHWMRDRITAKPRRPRAERGIVMADLWVVDHYKEGATSDTYTLYGPFPTEEFAKAFGELLDGSYEIKPLVRPGLKYDEISAKVRAYESEMNRAEPVKVP
jgi:hypothetical protein